MVRLRVPSRTDRDIPAPRLLHFIRVANDGTGRWPGWSSTFTSASWSQSRQVTNKCLTPFWRMFARSIGGPENAVMRSA